MFINSEAWVDEANCVGADPEIFFIEISSRTARTDRNRFESAQRICQECPVQQECLTFAEENDLVGMFGGKYVKP